MFDKSTETTVFDVISETCFLQKLVVGKYLIFNSLFTYNVYRGLKAFLNVSVRLSDLNLPPPKGQILCKWACKHF